MRFKFLAGIIIWTAAASVESALGAYSFTKIADTAGGAFSSFSPFNQNVSINESGEVAFSAQTPGSTSGVFKGSGGAVATIGTAADQSLATAHTTINDSGVVAYVGSGVVYTGNGSGAATPMYDATSGYTPSFGASINNGGSVAFHANPSGVEHVLTGNGGPLTIIANDAGLYLGFNRGPEINNAGQVAWRANYDAQATHSTIFRTIGGVDTVIVDSIAAGFTFLDEYILNDNGVVAFGAQSGLTFGIYNSSGSGVTTIVDSTGPFSFFTDGNHRPKPGYNDLGQFAFWALTDAGAEGIYTGTDPINDRVIAVGDTLFGKTITDISFSGNAFNNAGALAFVAVFNDGSRAVVRADVPEPASMAMVILGGATLMAPRRRR